MRDRGGVAGEGQLQGSRGVAQVRSQAGTGRSQAEGGRSSGAMLLETKAVPPSIGHGPRRSASAGSAKPPLGVATMGSKLGAPAAELSAASAACAAPSTATTPASPTAWWWRSRASSSWAWALPVPGWESSLRGKNAAEFDTTASRSWLCPNTCCWRHRPSQSLARLKTAALKVALLPTAGSACVCKGPSACCRVTVSPISATATSNSHTRLRALVGGSARRRVMVGCFQARQ